MKNLGMLSLTAAAGFFIMFQSGPTAAWEDYFDRPDKGDCRKCHNKVAKTCAGCHAHGTHKNLAKNDINITAKTNADNYQPGAQMTIEVRGGYRSGWVRVYLYDNPTAEGKPIAVSTGTASNGMGGGPAMPISFTVAAPTEPGTYTYSASWYGNKYDKKTNPFFGNWRESTTNPGHGEEIVQTNPFTVGNVEMEVPAEASAAPVIQR